MSDRILIIGLGSIGQRHARNALVLGYEVVGYDPVPKPEIILNAGQRLTQCESLNAALAHKPLGVIVATPPKTHWQIGYQASKAGLPCLIEKPLASDLSGAAGLCHAFEKQGVPLAVGYQFRHTAALRRLKAQADAGEFGTIYAAHAEFASQKWCSKTYSAELLLEASHEIETMCYFLGTPAMVLMTTREQGLLASGMMDWPGGAVGTFHLDGLSPDYRRTFTLYGTKSTTTWQLDRRENDAAYVEELRSFLAVCRGEAPPICTGRDGWRVLQVIEALRRSDRSLRWETL